MYYSLFITSWFLFLFFIILQVFNVHISRFPYDISSHFWEIQPPIFSYFSNTLDHWSVGGS